MQHPYASHSRSSGRACGPTRHSHAACDPSSKSAVNVAVMVVVPRTSSLKTVVIVVATAIGCAGESTITCVTSVTIIVTWLCNVVGLGSGAVFVVFDKVCGGWVVEEGGGGKGADELVQISRSL